MKPLTSSHPDGELTPIQPEPGDILLFGSAMGLNRVITWFTRSPYYHVALYAGDHCVVEARPGGVKRRASPTRQSLRYPVWTRRIVVPSVHTHQTGIPIVTVTARGGEQVGIAAL